MALPASWNGFKIKVLSMVVLALFVNFVKGERWSGLSFLQEPNDVLVRKYHPVWMHCLAKGEPTPMISWRKDDFPINFDHGRRRKLLSNGTLYIEVVANPKSEGSDEGYYQCVATLPGVGTVVSRRAKLTVAGMPKFDSQPENLTVFEGERARFACSMNSNPLATITWYHNNHPLIINSRMTILPSGSLEVENAEMSDNGAYYCHAMSLDKTKVSKEGHLKVKEAFALRAPLPPKFIAMPKSVEVLVGENVTLDCAANGYPEPSFTWLKDGSTIDMQNLDSRFLFLGSTKNLQISHIRDKDSGTYMCRADNGVDSQDAIAHLKVLVPPKFLKQPSDTEAHEKEDIILDCRVYGKPEPTVTWLKNGELIVESEYFQIDNGHSLKILGLVENDSGMYQCLARNTAGFAQASAELKVLRADSSVVSIKKEAVNVHVPEIDVHSPENIPSPPQHLQAVVTSNRFITLMWHEPEFNNEDIVCYSVFYRQENSTRVRVQNVSASSSSDSRDEYRTQISHLTPATFYAIRVVAFTLSGVMGLFSEETVVTTKPDLDLPGPPENLQVRPISPTLLNITWNPPSTVQTPITGYIMYYMKIGSAEEHYIDVAVLNYELQNLEEFTEYSVWVVAVNKNGNGDHTHEVIARTFSDVPTREPQNFTLEAASSRSLILRWEPPPPEHQNGIITGYKIRFREKNKPGSNAKTTDGNRRLYALDGLKKDTTYAIKISALTVNGSGPATQWVQKTTYASDLDEDRPPDSPRNLRAMPVSTSIHVRWQAPLEEEVMVRGYTIGWGRGIPDVYSKIVDSKQRSYVIEGLEPNAEYVISLRAFNEKGDGAPVYEHVRTRQIDKEPEATLTPPVGLKAEVLTPFTVSLQWTDTTLSRNQYLGDRGYYTIRYTTFSSASSSNPRYRYVNSSDVTLLIDGLKPATMYEFAVKAIKGHRESPWSLVASNATMEAKPSSPPRDVTVVTIYDDPSTVVFNWQPPKQANGKILYYLIFYSIDPTSNNWAVEKVDGDHMTCTLRGLLSSTLYFYKVHARNSKGFGPFSPVGNFTTLLGLTYVQPPESSSGWFLDRNTMIAVVAVSVAGAVILVGALLSLVIYCNKNSANVLRPPASKNIKVEVQPPDLWIHHDQLELKGMQDKSNRGSPCHTTALSHSGPDFDPDDKNTTYTSTSTLDRRTPYQSSYLRDCMGDEETDKLLNRRSLHPKPLLSSLVFSKDPVVGGSTSSSVYSDGTIGRPGYSLPQFSNNSSQCYSSLNENPYSLNHDSSLSAFDGLPPYDAVVPPPQTLLSSGLYSSLGTKDGGSSTLGKKMGNPLRSFSVPGPPQSAPTTPQPKHGVNVRLQGPTSPFKKCINLPSNFGVSAGRRVLPSGKIDSFPEHEELCESLLHGCSTEELSQEMANLEGLMKDLSAITAKQFNC